MNISEVNVYPIKSLAGIRLEASKVDSHGLDFDRRWVLTDANCTFRTQRELPHMALLRTAIRGQGLTVTAPDDAAIDIGPIATGDRRSIDVFGSESEAIEYDAAVNAWFSRALRTDMRLFYMPDDAGRPLNPRFAIGKERVSFADAYPLLVIGEASLAALNEKLERPLPMNRFRPNLVVSGTSAFEEDDWKLVRVGDAIFRAAKPCARCVIPSVDQATGVSDGQEPLRTLATFRKGAQVMPERLERLGVSPTGVLFGMNLIPETIGETVCVGDRVEVLEREA